MSLPVLQDLLAKLTSPYGGHYQVTSEDLNWEVNSPNTCTLDVAGTSITAHMTKHEQTAADIGLSGSVDLDVRTDNFTRADQDGWGTASGGTVWEFVDWDFPVDPLPSFSIVGNHGVQLTDGYAEGPLMLLGGDMPSHDQEILAEFSFSDFNSLGYNLLFYLLLNTDNDETWTRGAKLVLQTDGGLSFFIQNHTDNEFQGSNWSSAWNGGELNPGDRYKVRFRSVGLTYYLRVWFHTDTEPTDWLWQHTTTVPASDYRVGVASNTDGSSPAVEICQIYNFTAVSAEVPLTKTITDTFVRADQVDWGSMSDAVHTWSVGGTNEAAIVSNQGEFDLHTSSGLFIAQRRALPLPDVAPITRELLVRWKISSLDSNPVVEFHLDTDNNFGVGSWIQIPCASNAAFLYLQDEHFFDGSQNVATGDINADTYYWAHFKAIGNTYYFNHWADGNPEPSSWLLVYQSDINNYEHFVSFNAITPGLRALSFSTSVEIFVLFDNFSYNSSINVLSPVVDTTDWQADPIYKGIWAQVSAYQVNDVVFNEADSSFYKALHDQTPSLVGEDTFHRPDQSTWGTASDGTVWTPASYSNTINIFENSFDIVNNEGVVTYGGDGRFIHTEGTPYFGSLFFLNDLPSEFTDVLVRWSFDFSADNQWAGFGLVMNTDWTDAAHNWNNAAAEFEIETDDYLDTETYGYGGSDTDKTYNAFFMTGGQDYYTRFRSTKPFFGIKIWAVGDEEPATWNAQFSNTGVTVPSDRHYINIWPYNSASDNQVIRFKHWQVYQGTALSPDQDSTNWVLFDVNAWSEFTEYLAMEDVVNFNGNLYQLVQVNVPAAYTDTIDSHSESFNLYETDGQLPVLGTNESIPNVEDWLRGVMTSFFSAGNVGNLNSWSVGTVPDEVRDLVALTLVKGIE